MIKNSLFEVLLQKVLSKAVVVGITNDLESKFTFTNPRIWESS